LLYTVYVELNPANDTYIVDGRFLLHRVIWNRDDTFDLIFQTYINYIQKHFGSNVTIVFDGYDDNSKNIKAMEQRRRSAKLFKSTEVLFDASMKVPTSQEQFFSNTNNKKRFIFMLSQKLKDANINVKQAEDDADVLIIETALEQININKSIVVGEDINLLVLLIARTPAEKEIYFLKLGKAKVKTTIYSSKSFGSYIKSKDHILFLHAVTGCDTTSALFAKDKAKSLKILEKRDDLRTATEVFNKKNCSPQLIVKNGIRFLLAMYGAPSNEESLDTFRYYCFARSTRLNKAVKLSTLPPTSSAAQQHLYRVYYQVQTWLCNKLNPEDWGWIMVKNILEPIKTLMSPAPDILLHSIFCNCSKGCGGKCSCRKIGLHCSAVCGHCHGQSCLNATPDTTEDSHNTYEDIDFVDILAKASDDEESDVEATNIESALYFENDEEEEEEETD